MINLHGVHKTYPPEQVALRGVDLKVEQGEFLVIAGASGAGKSTLLRMLFGAETATSGQVVVGGRNLNTIDADQIADMRRDIGVIFQDYKLLPRRTVIDNVACVLEVQGVGARSRYDAARAMLKAVGLDDRCDDMPMMLSGGEQQRVAIARALVHKPRVLIADEPTGNLDPEMAAMVFELLMEANAAGITAVVASHNLAMIEELNLRTIVLDRGRIIGDFDNPGGIH